MLATLGAPDYAVSARRLHSCAAPDSPKSRLRYSTDSDRCDDRQRDNSPHDRTLQPIVQSDDLTSYN